MARQQVVEVRCDRCGRQEYRGQGDDAVERTDPELLIRVAGSPAIIYQDLCGPCAQAVRGYVESIVKGLKHKSPVRQAKKKVEKAEAPDKPVPPPPRRP